MKPYVNGLAITLTLACNTALAQLHRVERGDYTLRANAIASHQLPAESARAHGIAQAVDRGVLNVVVLQRRDGQDVPVAAQIEAVQRNLLGQSTPIAMRAVKANGRVSYLGTFEFQTLRNLHFKITATPAGGSDPLVVEFDERFVVKDR